MENQSISRAHYYERQFLRTPDFQDEQAYHLEMLRRHQVTGHIWGILRGLDLILTPDGVPMLLPGIAVDGFGRTLVWQAQQTLPLSEFDAKGSNILHVWLVYDELETDSGPDGANGCGLGDNPATNNRVQEQPTLRLAIPDTTHPKPRVPPGVDVANPEFDPTQNSPLSPDVPWPVYLGQVTRKREKPGKPWTYVLSMDGRPYAGLVGEMVMHPTENAWVEIGTPSEPDGKDTRFAVYLKTPQEQQSVQELPIQADDDPDPRLEITSDGQITLRGDATLNGNLIMEAGAIVLEAQDKVPAPNTTDPWPWMIYRAQGELQIAQYPGTAKAKKTSRRAKKAVEEETTTIQTNDLRLEMAGHGDGSHQVVIGAWATGPDGKEAFQPCLTIDDNCNVTVEKNLIVKGFIRQLEGSGEYAVTPELRSMDLGAYASTATSISAQVQKLYEGQLGGVTFEMLKKLLDTTDGRMTVLDALFLDQTLRDTFITELLDHPVGNPAGQDAVLVILMRDASRHQPVVLAIMGNANARKLMVDTLIESKNSQDTLVTELVGNLGKLDLLLDGVLSDKNALNETFAKILGQPNGIVGGAGALAAWLVQAAHESSLKNVLIELSNIANGPDQFWKVLTGTSTIADNFFSRLFDPSNQASLSKVAGELGSTTSNADAFWNAVRQAGAQNNLIGRLLDTQATRIDLASQLNDPTAGSTRIEDFAAAIKATLEANKLVDFIKVLQEAPAP
jgi:hypothetical protein